MTNRTRKPRGKGIAIGLIVVVVLALGGVGALALLGKKDAQGYLADAQAQLEKGNLSAAVIQFRNAVQRDPNDAQARFQLAMVLLRTGDAVSAEKEIKIAQERGVAEADTAPILAAAYLDQGKNDVLVKTIPEGSRPSEVESEIRTLRGMAQLALRDLAAAEASFSAAVEINPDKFRARIGLARIDSARQNYRAAEARLDAVLAQEPQAGIATEVHLLRGQIRRFEKDSDGALAAFGKVLEIMPSLQRARLERAEVLLEQNKDSAAAADVAYVLERNPSQPLAVHFQALILLRKGATDAAYELLQKQGTGLGRFPPSLLLMARIQYQRSQYEAAQTNLSEYLQAFPKSTDARLLLGSLLMRKNMPDQALTVLKAVPPEALAGDRGDLRVYRLLASASMRAGKVSEAGEWLEKAARVSNTAASRTQIAVERLSLGQTDAAIKDLDSAIELDPKSNDSKILLIITQMRQGQYDEAERLARAMQAELPDSPIPDNLLGGISMARGDRSGARSHFESAVRKQADFFPAQANIAKLDIIEGKLDNAIGRYRAILAQNAVNTDVMIAIAELLQRQRNSADAVAMMKRAVAVDGQAVRPRVAMINLLLLQQDRAGAMIAARELQKTAPGDVDAIDALGRVQLASGEGANAADTFRALVATLPGVPLAHERLAQALVAAGDVAGAKTALRTGLAANPDAATLAAELVNLLHRTGESEVALSEAREWRRRHPDGITGDLILANALALQQKFDEASGVLAAAFKKNPSSTTAVSLAKARLAAGKSAEATDGLEAWLKDRPKDIVARDTLASAYLTLGRYEAAEKASEEVLRGQPDNPIVLNNLAWLYGRRNDPRAVAFAERAHAILPQVPAVMDTLGYILVRGGDVARGVSLLRAAYQASQQSPEIGYHLAVGLDKSGQDQEARAVLEAVVADPRSFDDQAEAKKMLDSLGKK